MAEIEVTGVGRVSVVPDLCSLNVHARSTAQTASEALEEAAALAHRAIEVLETARIPSEDRGGSPAGVHRETRWQDEREVFLGWTATYRVHATIRDVALAYEVVEKLSEVDGLDTNGPHWQVAPDNEAHSMARHAAVADARGKAEDLAEATGMDLGPLRHITDGVATPAQGRMRAMESMADSGGSMEPGTQEVQATVTLTFSATPSAL